MPWRGNGNFIKRVYDMLEGWNRMGRGKQSHGKVGIGNGGGNGMAQMLIRRWNRKWRRTEQKWKKIEQKWKGGTRSWVQKSRTGSWEKVRIGVPRVQGGSRWVFDC